MVKCLLKRVSYTLYTKIRIRQADEADFQRTKRIFGEQTKIKNLRKISIFSYDEEHNFGAKYVMMITSLYPSGGAATGRYDNKDSRGEPEP
jgi:hypothetical protein